ncbi:hypothetical protein BDZ45DRAFT_249428 [Acephala macrosclerotiorum]|nr:hypothetical protein BDZ45DRAFT_249428 [Acephala macrosclerotiorum]
MHLLRPRRQQPNLHIIRHHHALANCTTIPGSILIANNYISDLGLPGIHTITDGISIYDVDPSHALSALFLTSMTALDVVTIGEKGISGFNSVVMLEVYVVSGFADGRQVGNSCWSGECGFGVSEFGECGECLSSGEY